jgi:hypothetical protein
MIVKTPNRRSTRFVSRVVREGQRAITMVDYLSKILFPRSESWQRQRKTRILILAILALTASAIMLTGMILLMTK